MIKDSLRQKRHTRHQPLFYFPYANRQKNSHSKTRKDQIVIYQIKPDLIEATGPLFLERILIEYKQSTRSWEYKLFFVSICSIRIFNIFRVIKKNTDPYQQKIGTTFESKRGINRWTGRYYRPMSLIFCNTRFFCVSSSCH